MPPPEHPPMTLATVLSSSSAGTPARALFQAHTDSTIVSAVPITSTMASSSQVAHVDTNGSQVLGTITQPTVTVGYSQDVSNSHNSIRDDVSVHSQGSSASSVIVTRQVPPHQLFKKMKRMHNFPKMGPIMSRRVKVTRRTSASKMNRLSNLTRMFPRYMIPLRRKNNNHPPRSRNRPWRSIIRNLYI